MNGVVSTGLIAVAVGFSVWRGVARSRRYKRIDEQIAERMLHQTVNETAMQVMEPLLGLFGVTRMEGENDMDFMRRAEAAISAMPTSEKYYLPESDTYGNIYDLDKGEGPLAAMSGMTSETNCTCGHGPVSACLVHSRDPKIVAMRCIGCEGRGCGACHYSGKDRLGKR